MQDIKIHFHDNDTTQMRLIKAAQALISTVGYDAASTRMITNLAGVNLSAINFHFGSKENLIKEAIRLAADKYKNVYKRNAHEAHEYLKKTPIDKEECWKRLYKYLDYKMEDALNVKFSWINIGIAEHENNLPDSSKGIMADTVVEYNEMIVAAYIMELSDHKDDFQAVILARSIMAALMSYVEKPLINQAYERQSGISLEDRNKVKDAMMKNAMRGIHAFVDDMAAK